MKTYTKRDIVRLVAESTDQPMYEVEPQVDATLEAMLDILTDADPVCRIELRGFGIFTVKRTKAKPRARNPRTNEEIYVPAHRKVHFKPAKPLKEFLSQPLVEQS